MLFLTSSRWPKAFFCSMLLRRISTSDSDERLLNRRARWGGFAVFVFLVMERVFCSAGQSSSV